MSWLEDADESLADAADRVPLVSNSTTLVIAAITVLAILLRLVFLGDRIAHMDEARVAYWINYYAETGSFAYRAIIHGPFVQHVGAILFSLLGPSDFVARLPVAIVGGLFPLSAYLFRDYLRRLEVVLLAGFLAFNPILLYYSRFLRSDVLVGAFMFVALGFIARFYATRETKYLYGVAVFSVLGFASKENAILYVLTWLGAAALMADQALFRPRAHRNGLSLVLTKAGYARDRFRAARDRPVRFLRGYPLHLLGAVILAFVVFLYFFAPRGRGLPGLYFTPTGDWIGFWEAVFNPTQLLGMMDRTIGHTIDQLAFWFGEGSTPPRLDFAAADRGVGVDQLRSYDLLRDVVAEALALFVTAYLITLGGFVGILLTKAGPLVALGFFGFVYERYVADESRNLVLLGGYAAIASLLGYALGADIFGPWLVLHVVIPLSIPAAVGLARLAAWGLSAIDDDDTVGRAAFGVLALLLFLMVFGTALSTVYVNDQAPSNSLVQYAQPSDDMRPALQDLERISTEHEGGPDVIVYSGATWDAPRDRSILVQSNVTAATQPGSLAKRPACVRWINMLPLPWYFSAYDTQADCERGAATLLGQITSDSPPPVVITAFEDDTVPRDSLRQSYEPRTYRLRALAPQQPLTESAPQERRITIWTHQNWIEGG